MLLKNYEKQAQNIINNLSMGVFDKAINFDSVVRDAKEDLKYRKSLEKALFDFVVATTAFCSCAELSLIAKLDNVFDFATPICATIGAGVPLLYYHYAKKNIEKQIKNLEKMDKKLVDSFSPMERAVYKDYEMIRIK